MGQKMEKSKDFKGTLIKLFKNLDHWKYMLIIATIFAFASAVLSTIGPNKLADVTDVISDGIKPDVAKFEDISKEILSGNTRHHNSGEYDILAFMCKYNNPSERWS